MVGVTRGVSEEGWMGGVLVSLKNMGVKNIYVTGSISGKAGVIIESGDDRVSSKGLPKWIASRSPLYIFLTQLQQNVRCQRHSVGSVCGCLPCLLGLP